MRQNKPRKENRMEITITWKKNIRGHVSCIASGIFAKAGKFACSAHGKGTYTEFLNVAGRSNPPGVMAHRLANKS